MNALIITACSRFGRAEAEATPLDISKIPNIADSIASGKLNFVIVEPIQPTSVEKKRTYAQTLRIDSVEERTESVKSVVVILAFTEQTACDLGRSFLYIKRQVIPIMTDEIRIEA